MAKKRKPNYQIKETPLDRGRVFDLLLALILVMAICLKGSYFPQSYLLILVTTGVWLLVRLPYQTLPALWKDPFIVLLGMILACYILANFTVVGNRYTAVLETLKIAALLLFFLAVRLSRDIIILYRGIITGCLLLALFGLLAYLGILDFPQAVLWSGRIPRLQSLLQYANVMALFMGIAYFLSLYLSHRSTSVKQKRSYYLYSYLFLLTLFWTYSRGGIAVFLVFVWVWVYLQTNLDQAEWLETLRQVVAAALFAFLIGILISYNQPFLAFLVLFLSFWIMYQLWQWKSVPQVNRSLIRLALLIPPAVLMLGGIGLVIIGQKTIILSRAGTFLERIISMQDAVTLLQQYPWLGIGPGSWSSLQFKYQSAQYIVRYVHNGFLQLALDAGLIALLGLLLILLLFYVGLIRNLRVNKDYYELLPGIALGFILVHSLIDIGLNFTSLLLIMAVILNHQPLSDKLDQQKSRIEKLDLTVPKLLLATVILTITGVACYVWNGVYLYSQGQAAVQNQHLSEGRSLLHESIPYRPGDAEVFLALAQTTPLSDQEGKTTINYLEKARRLDRYEPRYVEELLNLEYQRDNLAEVYRYSRIFIELKPRDPQGYLKAIWSLEQLYANQEIDLTSYTQGTADIQRAQEQSKESLHPLAHYLYRND